MKKTYIKPELMVIKLVSSHQILAGSETAPLSGEQVPEGTAGGSRSFSFGDED